MPKNADVARDIGLADPSLYVRFPSHVGRQLGSGRMGQMDSDLEVTDEAVEVLSRSLRLAGLDPKTAGVRLRPAHGLGGGTDVQIEFAESPAETDQIIETGGIRLFVDRALFEAVPDPLLVVEPQHETVAVRPRSGA
jgi:Fe-S cluster assembly iron-binding protein IscA